MAVVAYLALTLAVAATLCGHQGQPWPFPRPWRTVRAAMPSRRPQAPVSRPQTLSRGSRSVTDAPRAFQAPSRPAPSWAHTEPNTHKEAA